MTDNDIIKALEHCSCGHLPCGRECPGWQVGCETEKYALDLIRRQKAEIERLEELVYKLKRNSFKSKNEPTNEMTEDEG